MQVKFACLWVSYFPRRNICTSVIRRCVYNQELILSQSRTFSTKINRKEKTNAWGLYINGTFLQRLHSWDLLSGCVHPHDAQVLQLSWGVGAPPLTFGKVAILLILITVFPVIKIKSHIWILFNITIYIT